MASIGPSRVARTGRGVAPQIHVADDERPLALRRQEDEAARERHLPARLGTEADELHTHAAAERCRARPGRPDDPMGGEQCVQVLRQDAQRRPSPAAPPNAGTRRPGPRRGRSTSRTAGARDGRAGGRGARPRCSRRLRPWVLEASPLGAAPPPGGGRRNGPPACASGRRSRRALPGRGRRQLRAADRASLLLLRLLLAQDHRLGMGLEVVHEVAERLQGVDQLLQGLGGGEPGVVVAAERPLRGSRLSSAWSAVSRKARRVCRASSAVGPVSLAQGSERLVRGVEGRSPSGRGSTPLSGRSGWRRRRCPGGRATPAPPGPLQRLAHVLQHLRRSAAPPAWRRTSRPGRPASPWTWASWAARGIAGWSPAKRAGSLGRKSRSMYFWPVSRLALIRRARMPRSISPRANVCAATPMRRRPAARSALRGISTTLAPGPRSPPRSGSSASGRPVRIAFTSCTSPDLDAAEGHGAPLSRPLTEPGKYDGEAVSPREPVPGARATMAASTRAIAPRTKAPTARGWVFGAHSRPRLRNARTLGSGLLPQLARLALRDHGLPLPVEEHGVVPQREDAGSSWVTSTIVVPALSRCSRMRSSSRRELKGSSPAEGSSRVEDVGVEGHGPGQARPLAHPPADLGRVVLLEAGQAHEGELEPGYGTPRPRPRARASRRGAGRRSRPGSSSSRARRPGRGPRSVA